MSDKKIIWVENGFALAIGPGNKSSKDRIVYVKTRGGEWVKITNAHNSAICGLKRLVEENEYRRGSLRKIGSLGWKPLPMSGDMPLMYLKDFTDELVDRLAHADQVSPELLEALRDKYDVKYKIVKKNVNTGNYQKTRVKTEHQDFDPTQCNKNECPYHKQMLIGWMCFKPKPPILTSELYKCPMTQIFR